MAETQERTAGTLVRPQDTADVCLLRENGDVIWWARVSTLDNNVSIGDLRDAAANIVKCWNGYPRLVEKLKALDKAAFKFRMLFNADGEGLTLDIEDFNLLCQKYEALSNAAKEARAVLSDLGEDDNGSK